MRCVSTVLVCLVVCPAIYLGAWGSRLSLEWKIGFNALALTGTLAAIPLADLAAEELGEMRARRESRRQIRAAKYAASTQQAVGAIREAFGQLPGWQRDLVRDIRNHEAFVASILSQTQAPRATDLGEPGANLPTYDWNDAPEEAVGFLIVGNSGSGKTSVAAWLLGLLTQSQPSEVYVLDPHCNDVWEGLDLPIVADIPEIESALTTLLGELDRRQQRKRQRQPLGNPIIIVADELGACDKRFQDAKATKNALERLGAEGRKFGMTFIGIHHSSREEDLKISSQYRANYLVVLLGAAARNKAKQWGKDYQLAVQGVAYPALVCGCCEDALATHPTHGHYTEFRKHGNAPKGLLPIRQLPPSILAVQGAESVQADPEQSEPLNRQRELLDRLFSQPSANSHPTDSVQQKTPTPTQWERLRQVRELIDKGIKSKNKHLDLIWGVKPGGNAAYKQASQEYDWLMAFLD